MSISRVFYFPNHSGDSNLGEFSPIDNDRDFPGKIHHGGKSPLNLGENPLDSFL